MPLPKSSDPFSSSFNPSEHWFTDQTHGLMVLAVQGARRIALQQERVDRLADGAQQTLVAEAQAQLRIMTEAQKFRMQLFSAAEREIIEAEVRRWQRVELPAEEARPIGVRSSKTR